MKTNLEKISNLQRKLNVEVPATAVQASFENVYKALQKRVDIKGFRKGKAPLATIKSLYGDRVKQDVLQDILETHYRQALNELKVDPISYPEFEFDDLDSEKPFSFSASFDVRPEINVRKFEGLEVEKEKFEVDEAQVDKVIENIRTSRAELGPVLEDRPAQMGDISIIDFEGFVDGKPLEGGKGENHQLDLGANQFIAGFEEGVEGMKVGGTKTLSLKFPDPYHSKDLAGKPVEFKVTLKELKKKALPEVTEEFLKSIGGPATVEDLRNSIRKDIEESEKKRIEGDLKNRLLKELVKNNPVDVPSSMLQDQKKTLVEDFESRMRQQGMSTQDYEEYKSKWDADFTKSASEMIQSGFLIDTLAKDLNLKCTPADIEARFEQYASQTGIELAKIKDFYGKPEQKSRLSYQITEEKVVAHLIEKAKIKEVPKSNLSDKTDA
ncbi:MAG: trigger factor [Pseudobdellovibrionaceae bacterium]